MSALSTEFEEKLLSIAEAAKRLSISVRSVWRLIAAAQLPVPVKIGRCSRLCASDIEAYLQKLKSQRPEQV
jgi:excisionase family DNA binding protein